MIDKLKEILSTQLRLMQELLVLLERETSELLDMNLEAIAEINVSKESTTERINEYTVPLRETISEIAVSFELQEKATLVEVVTLLGKQGYKKIPRLYQDLNTHAKQMRHVAALNQDIAEHSVSMVKAALLILAQLLNQSGFYCASGSYLQWQDGGIIINKDV